jgi:hypothetical protein
VTDAVAGRMADGPSSSPSFERDICPLFREEDRVEMEYMFDLWAYDEVKEAAESILDRLEDGTMPCDYPWDEKQIAKFRAWIDTGCQP